MNQNKKINIKEVFAVVTPKGDISYSWNKGPRLYNNFTSAKRGLAHSEKGSSIAKFEFTDFVYDGRAQSIQKDINERKKEICFYKKYMKQNSNDTNIVSEYIKKIEDQEEKIYKLNQELKKLKNEEAGD